MKSITRLFLSKNKQRALSVLHRVNDVRDGFFLGRRIARYERGDSPAIRGFLIEEVIEDHSRCILRITCITPYRNGEGFVCAASPAFGEECACEVFVIAKHFISPSADASIGKEPWQAAKLLLSIRIPKRVASYAISLACASRPEIRGSFTLKESEYGKLLHEARMLAKSAENDFTYPRWFRQRKANDATLCEQRFTDFADNPIFSIVVPLFNTPLKFFDDMLRSVEAQSYPYWQLVLVNASPEMEGLCKAISESAAKDERITVVTLEENLGITLNTNAGIDAAIGDFVCFLDHDDIIEPDILFEYARAIDEHPATDVLYCDEDKLMPNGEYMHPFFKPDYSPDLLLSVNYICHMLSVRASILASFEPAGPGFDGAQDYNCVLQATEKARHVHHVRRVLYHWRMSSSSTASGSESKPYAIKAGLTSIENHLQRLGRAACVTPADIPFWYETAFPIVGNPLVSVIIPARNDIGLLDACISSISEKTAYPEYEILVIACDAADSGIREYCEERSSHDGRLRFLEFPQEDGGAISDSSCALGFGAGHARGDYLVFLSCDVQVITPDWITAMLEYCQREDVGAVGTRILCADGTIFHSGIALGNGSAIYLYRNSTLFPSSYFGMRDAVQELSAVSSSCMMTRKRLFDEHGGFEKALSGEHQGIDYCLRLREAGFDIVFNPHAEIRKQEPYPLFGKDDSADAARDAGQADMLKQLHEDAFAEGDPYYNVNLQCTGRERGFYHLARNNPSAMPGKADIGKPASGGNGGR